MLQTSPLEAQWGNLGLNGIDLGRGEAPLAGPRLLGLECIRRNDVQVPLWEWNGKSGDYQYFFGLLRQVTEQVPVVARVCPTAHVDVDRAVGQLLDDNLRHGIR